MDPRAPAQQPSPSGSPFELKHTPLGKKLKLVKGREKEPKELEDKGRGGRRRSRRIVESNAKRKLRVGASQEEESDLKGMDSPK